MSLTNIQVILTLQQLKINNKEIDNLLNCQELPIVDSSALYENYKNNAFLPIKKRTELTKESVKNAWDLAYEIMNCSSRENVQIISKTDNKFPVLLKELQDCPQLLHVKGNIKKLNSNCIAIVGTRNPTQFGKEKAEKLSAELANKDFTIVSGLARGVDTAAHEGALKSNGYTIAVLAHGLQTIYPAENKDLASRILKQNGTLISEYPWYTNSESWRLVQRDRIQSGISFGVLVIETGVNGGTMHTVKFCRKQERLLMVLHHPKKYENEENIQGNKEIIKKFSGNNKFWLINENDDAQKIIEKFRDLKIDLHISDISQINKTDQTRDMASPNSIQNPRSGFVRASMIQSRNADGAELKSDFQDLSEKKKGKRLDKKNLKSKKSETYDDKKTWW